MDSRLKDAFDALGIAPTGSMSDVKIAYHRLALSVHPDMHGCDPDSYHRFLDVKDAYDLVRSYLESGMRISVDEEPCACDLDLLIAGMSASERRFRCSADVDGHYNQVSSKYVLVRGTGAMSGSWGLAVLAYNLPMHSDIVDAYVRGAGSSLYTLDVLGGGRLEICWLLNGDGPIIRTYWMSMDYGPPKSLLAVKACIESLMHDYYPWADTVRYDIK